jgi:hypothetical protein
MQCMLIEHFFDILSGYSFPQDNNWTDDGLDMHKGQIRICLPLSFVGMLARWWAFGGRDCIGRVGCYFCDDSFDSVGWCSACVVNVDLCVIEMSLTVVHRNSGSRRMQDRRRLGHDAVIEIDQRNSYCTNRHVWSSWWWEIMRHGRGDRVYAGQLLRVRWWKVLALGCAISVL